MKPSPMGMHNAVISPNLQGPHIIIDHFISYYIGLVGTRSNTYEYIRAILTLEYELSILCTMVGISYPAMSRYGFAGNLVYRYDSNTHSNRGPHINKPLLGVIPCLSRVYMTLPGQQGLTCRLELSRCLAIPQFGRAQTRQGIHLLVDDISR